MIQANGFLASGINTQVTGEAMDNRYGFTPCHFVYYCSGSGVAASNAGSAIFNLEASHDATGWMIHATFTATATQTGTAQVASFYPYVRLNVTKIYSASTGTGAVYAHFSPILSHL